ncbi:hypothetical protein KJ570_01245 [Patescibacteria group bacterium]|nr:hypothetical protein [Patescibacteria group bacterium]
MIKLKKVIKKEIKKEKEVKEKKNNKSLSIPLVIVAVLALVGVLGYKFFYKAVRTRISNYRISKSLSKQLGGDVKIEGDGEKVSYKGEDFEFSYDMGGELPENFPKDLPIYNNSKLLSKWSSTDEENEGISIVLETSDSVAKVSDYYKLELEKTGWDITSTFSQEDSSVYSFEKGDKEGILGITNADDKVSISITITNK